MAGNRTTNGSAPPAPSDSIEEDLRGMPSIAPPDGLEERLIAALEAPRPRRLVRPGLVVPLAVAAAVLVILFCVPIGRRGGAARDREELLDVTSVDYVLFENVLDRSKETDPCNLLPVFSNG